MGLSFEELLLFNQGEQVDDSQFYLGRNIDIWISSKLLDTRLLVTEDVLEGQETIKVITNEPIQSITLYRNEVIKMFDDGIKVIVKGEVTLYPFVENVIPIYRAKENILKGNSSRIYGMIPLMSAKEGGFPQVSVTYAEAHNKNQGLYPVFQPVRRDSTVTISGDINLKDASIKVLKDIQKGYVNKLFVQIRHSLVANNLGIEYGEGGLAVEYWGIPHIALVDNESGFVSFQLELKVIGEPQKYTIPTGIVPVRYCPLDVIYKNYYHIEFTVVSEEDTSSYCPLDTTGFYDFVQEP